MPELKADNAMRTMHAGGDHDALSFLPTFSASEQAQHRLVFLARETGRIQSCL